MNISVAQKVIIAVTLMLVMAFLGLSVEFRTIDNKIINVKTCILSIYGFPLGISQYGFCSNIRYPINEFEQGLVDIIPMVQYKYHAAIVTFLMGYLFFATFKKKRMDYV